MGIVFAGALAHHTEEQCEENEEVMEVRMLPCVLETEALLNMEDCIAVDAIRTLDGFRTKIDCSWGLGGYTTGTGTRIDPDFTKVELVREDKGFRL